MLWIGEVDDAKSIDELVPSASITGRLIPDFENLDFKIASRLMKILEGTSKDKSPQPKEKLNQRRDHLRADRLLGWSTTSSKSVATMKPSSTSEVYRKFN